MVANNANSLILCPFMNELDIIIIFFLKILALNNCRHLISIFGGQILYP